MGQIHRFDIKEIISKFKTSIYIETGTGEGISLSHVIEEQFEHFYSIDLDSDLIAAAKVKFKNSKNLTLINSLSTEALESLIPKLDKNKNALFFLDAHFPGADFHKISYEESIRTFKEQAFPLEKELKIINQNRDTKKDVFIIDDFILYEPNREYETIKKGVTFKYKWLQNELNINTDSQNIYNLFEKTHEFTIDLRDQGYLIITPKNEI